MLEGYSPKVFQRKRPKQRVLNNTQVSSVEQFDGTRMEERVIIDEKNGDSKSHPGSTKDIDVSQSLSVRMEMDENATSSTAGDALQETDSIPSQPHMRLKRKTNTETETGVGLPSGEVSVDNDDDGALTVSGNILSQPDKRLRGKTNMRAKRNTLSIGDGVLRESQPDRKTQRKTKTGRQLPSDTAAPSDHPKRDETPDSMQFQLKRKTKKTSDTKTKPRMRLPNDAATLIKMKTDPWQVCLFLRQVLLKVVPDELWGSVHNRNVFLKGF